MSKQSVTVTVGRHSFNALFMSVAYGGKRKMRNHVEYDCLASH